MLKSFYALLWSRKEIVLANKAVLVNLFMPLLMVVIYQFLYKGKEGSDFAILFSCLPMVPSFVGYLLPTLVAEEAEKNNQRSLRLAGVSDWYYVLASLVLPILLTVVYFLALPLYLRISFADLGWAYFLIMSLTSVLVLLLFLLVSLLTDTQTRATLLAMPVMLLTSFLPLFSFVDEQVKKWIDFTFLGAFTKYSQLGKEYTLTDRTFWILLVWLLAVSLALLAVMKKRARV